ncbi:hypothetical protein RO3G_09396 [Rhizopus delemar RA 99-880]|uniref:Uncharacterized protein n=1 Tax=Rhizopus delemar (strain RA 99-880 / ATCC MYA-4621 / FGSC 9543 / NRRL 43880) TaxID=246409 RepID=I1C8A6_RHIO9|nr:hypothetical protein RO3G_09396 [Rhizopus delemar RA 99-880]|eukprot:EIE84686.1 hypothetical protein RO3G_09396 [Rhizopus delemar RA 99-880]
MTFSTIISKENDITIPTPTLSTEPHPVAMAPAIAHNMMEITIEHDTTVEIEDKIFNDNPLVTFIILSGLIINDHVKNLLKSLGNDPEAIKTILYFNKSHNNQAEYNENDEDEDVGSLSYSYHQHHYPGHRSLVENEDRWSSAHSFKSIELNPGVWHWWHKVWWSCFPCCMPGGCCDRACIKLKGHNSRSNSRPLSRKGWQQQY